MNSVDFSLWLERMNALPASAPQWDQAHKFIADATGIIKLKEVENAQATEFTTLLDNIRECFSGELVYLGRNVDSVELGFTFFSDALRVARELETLLHNFRSVRARQPESFDEEEQLSSERIEAGGRVRETIDRLNELLSIPDLPPTETEPEETLDTHRSQEVEGHGQDGIKPSGEVTDSGPESLIEQNIAHPERNDLFSLDERESSEGLVEAISGIEITDSVQADLVVQPMDGKQNDKAIDQDDDKDQEVLSLKPKRIYGIELPVESATRYIESSSLYDLETLMWSLIAHDDLSGAYWISTYLDAEGYESPATPMLLKAVQGARWLSSDVDRFAGELFEIVADYVRSERSSSQDLLEFAASVHSTAVASHSQMLDWLKTPDCCPELERIVRQIRELPNKGISLRPEYVRGLGETVSQNEGIASASEDARKWMEEAPMKRTKYGRANSVWKHLTDDGGGLSNMLGPVKDDVRNDVDKVREGLSGWNPDSSLEMINLIDRELETGKVPKPPITGDARNWLLRGIEEARKKADRWCRLVEGEDEVRAKLSNSYLIEQVSELRSQVQSVFQLVMEALYELSSDANPIEIAASALCAKRSLHQLLRTLGIEFDDVKHISPIVPELVSIIGDTGDLNLAMARRLLWTGNVKLDDDGLPIKDSLDAVIQDLANSVQNENTLGQAIESRMDRQDYRFIDSVSRAIPDEIKDSIKTRLQKAIQDSTDMFEDYITIVERRVRQAARDGIIEIDDSNWIDYNSRIEGIRLREDTLNFSLVTEELEDVEIGLQELSESRYTDLCEEWESVLSEQPDDNSNIISSWKEKFNTAKDRRDIRVMEECLMRLRTGSIGIPYHDLDLDDGSEDGAKNSLANFISFFEEVQDIEGYTHTNTGLRALQSRLSSLG